MIPVIGLPRGKMQAPTYEALKKAGVELPGYNPTTNSRDYRIDHRHAIFFIDNPRDLATRVSAGDLNAAIAGSDSVRELQAEHQTARKNKADVLEYPPDSLETIRLPQYMSWRVVVLARDDLADPTFERLLNRLVQRDMRYRNYSWTEYPYTEAELIQRIFPEFSTGIYPHSDGEVIIFTSQGTTESKLRKGDSMFGLEVVSTGQTVEANQLKEFAETSQTHGPVILKPYEFSDGFVEDLTNRLAGVHAKAEY